MATPPAVVFQPQRLVLINGRRSGMLAGRNLGAAALPTDHPVLVCTQNKVFLLRRADAATWAVVDADGLAEVGRVPAGQNDTAALVCYVIREQWPRLCPRHLADVVPTDQPALTIGFEAMPPV